MSPDHINGCFEFLAAIFIVLHLRQIWKDKEVKGVSIMATTFFFLWGIWNVYFYPSQGLWWSFYGGLCVVVTNLVYLVALVYFCDRLSRKRQRQRDIADGLQKCKREGGWHWPQYIGCNCLR